MRYSLVAVLLIAGTRVTLASGELRWPDAEIPVPSFVHSFIVAECLDYAGSTEEDVDACVAGERFGYRATVMMLSNPETSEEAAERYRVCQTGLGMHGGRFHRRKAECIGSTFRYKWRFESTRHASIQESDPVVTIRYE